MGASFDSHVREFKAHTNVNQADETFTHVNTFAERLKSARLAVGLSQTELARLAKISTGAIGNYEAGTRDNPRELFALSAALGVNPEWLQSGRGRRDFREAVAHSLSQRQPNNDSHDDPQRVAWGSMKTADLPEVFQVEVPDDAMADRVLKGHLVKFSRAEAPRAGDGVLVEDAAGQWHFRQYSPGAQGRFAAVAKNSAYQTLDSERDGLKVIAVLVGIPEARWGQ
jgi:transcriptional regulator with XRE-family HTH domain